MLLRLSSDDKRLIQDLLVALDMVADNFSGYNVETKFGCIKYLVQYNGETDEQLDDHEFLVLLDLLALGNDISYWVNQGTDNEDDPWMDLYHRIGAEGNL